MAQRHREQPVQQRMSAMLMTLFTAKKANHTLQTMRLQHLRLAVYSSEFTRAGERWSSNEAASDRSLVVWPAADRCR